MYTHFKKIALTFSLFNLLCCSYSLSYDVTLPYHARFFPGETRLAKKHLTSLDIRVSGTTNAQCRVQKQADLYNTSSHSFIFSATHNPTDSLFASLTLPLYHIRPDYVSHHCHSIKELAFSTWTAGIILNSFATKRLDYIDVSLETGLLFPPSAHRRNGIGVPLKLEACLGIFDWITMGGEADIATFFGPNNSFQYNACWFLKADHLVRGLSLLLGYSYSHQEPAPYLWHPLCCNYWSMHTLHFKFSYDLASENHPGLPALEIEYNRLLNGINVTGNSLVGLHISSTF